MKAILALLLIACAAQAYNTTEYNMGYYAMFDFSDDQNAAIQACVQGVHSLEQDAIALVQSLSQGAEQTLMAAIKLVADAPLQTINDCEDYKNYMSAYVQENAVIPEGDTLEQAIEANLQTYAPEIIQGIAQWADYIVTGQDYLAGQTQAVIFQTLLGAYHYNYPVATVNASDIVPFNATAFYSEFYTSFLSNFGLTNQSAINVFINCGSSINSLTMDILTLRQQYAQGENALSNIPLLIQGAEALYSSVESCVESFEIEKQFNANLIQAFEASPLMTIAHIMFNVATNLPEILYQYQADTVAAIEQGEYALAGEIEAEQQAVIFNGYIN